MAYTKVGDSKVHIIDKKNVFKFIGSILKKWPSAGQYATFFSNMTLH